MTVQDQSAQAATEAKTHGVVLTDVAAAKVKSLLEQEGRDDLRLRVADERGVMADITRILADSGISIDALLQKESEQVDAQGKAETDIILITHETLEKSVNAAIARIEKLATVVSSVTKLRMEALN